jgi:hypothetical protein
MLLAASILVFGLLGGHVLAWPGVLATSITASLRPTYIFERAKGCKS